VYSVKINLIGCDEQIVPNTAREILQRWAIVDASYPTVTVVRKNVLVFNDETRLFVMHIGSAYDVTELKRLSGHYPHCAILAIVDMSCDAEIVLMSLRAGAMQVVRQPVLPDELQEALDCIAAKQPGLSKLAQLVTVTSTVGGCGGTTVAINTAYGLARLAKARCILMELSLRKGVLANHLNITPRYTTNDLAIDIQRLDSRVLEVALTEVAKNLTVMVGPYESINTDLVDIDKIMQLIQLTQNMASWLVLDVPGTFDELFFRTLTVSDQIVLVADQTVASLRCAQMVCDTLGQRRPIVVINRYRHKNGDIPIDRIRDFLPGCDIHTFADDPTVMHSMNCGQALSLSSRDSPVLADIDALIMKLEPAIQPARRNRSIMSRLGRALSFT
jgi:Flp pilus assembly CpaE family ATPase